MDVERLDPVELDADRVVVPLGEDAPPGFVGAGSGSPFANEPATSPIGPAWCQVGGDRPGLVDDEALRQIGDRDQRLLVERRSIVSV